MLSVITKLDGSSTLAENVLASSESEESSQLNATKPATVVKDPVLPVGQDAANSNSPKDSNKRQDADMKAIEQFLSAE